MEKRAQQQKYKLFKKNSFHRTIRNIIIIRHDTQKMKWKKWKMKRAKKSDLRTLLIEKFCAPFGFNLHNLHSSGNWHSSLLFHLKFCVIFFAWIRIYWLLCVACRLDTEIFSPLKFKWQRTFSPSSLTTLSTQTSHKLDSQFFSVLFNENSKFLWWTFDVMRMRRRWKKRERENILLVTASRMISKPQKAKNHHIFVHTKCPSIGNEMMA